MKTAIKFCLILCIAVPAAILLILSAPQFSALWHNHDYWKAYQISAALTAVIVPVQLAVALLMAYGLTRWRSRAKNIIALLYCLLALLPAQVMLLPNYLVCKAFRLLNTHAAVALLGIFSPLPVFLLFWSMQRIEKGQSEAALLDGANEWELFWHIYLPQVKDSVFLTGAFVFLDCWSMVEIPLVLLSDAKKQLLSILLTQESFPAPYAGAAVYMLPIVLALICWGVWVLLIRKQ